MLIKIFERIRGEWHTQKHKKAAAQLYAVRWIGLWHREDEAISALSNVKHVSAPVIPSTFLMPFAAVAPVLFTVMAALYLGYDIMTSRASTFALLNLTGNWDAALRSFFRELTGGIRLQWELTFSLIWIGLMAAYIGITYIATILLKPLAGWLGIPLARIINSLVWASVRQGAWGDDMVREGVSEIGSHPPEFGRMFESLPDAVADPLRRHSEKHAILTLQKVREVLGVTRNPQTAPDLRAQLSDTLNWRELIHTSYFDIPEFLDLTAVGLHRAGLADFKDEFIPAAGRDQVEAWYSAISAQPAESSDEPVISPS